MSCASKNLEDKQREYRIIRVPVQLAIPVQNIPEAQVGDEVFFFRRGTIMDENRVVHDTWWLVDNGFIGTDGVARTASPPFEGIDASGEYAIMRSPFQNTGTPIEVALAIGSSGMFGGLGFSLAGMNASMNIAGIPQ